MRRGLYFKIILILVVFILIVMSVVGAVLISNVMQYYNEEFSDCMTANFESDRQLRTYLENAMVGESAASEESVAVAAQSMKSILSSYSSRLGIDDYRDFYILSANGEFLAGSDNTGEELAATPNLLAAMHGEVGREKNQGSTYADYALPLEKDGAACIIYIRDTQEELRQITWVLFSIILEALFIGLLIAFVLSFFLARAISLPLSKLTAGVQRVAEGDFKEKIHVRSGDEIGVLT